MSWLRFEASHLASFRRGHGAFASAAGQVDLRAVLADIRGIAVATARPLPGRCADIASDVLPDVARLSRDHLAGLRAVFGEPLASRNNLVLTRGNACLQKNVSKSLMRSLQHSALTRKFQGLFNRKNRLPVSRDDSNSSHRVCSSTKCYFSSALLMAHSPRLMSK